MEIKILGDDVRVYEVGLALLKLKTELTARIGTLVTSGKDYVSFPASALHDVNDLLTGVHSADLELKSRL